MTLNPLKKFLAVSLTSLVLVGCGVQTEQPIDEAEKVEAVLNELRKQYRGGFIVTHPVTKW